MNPLPKPISQFLKEKHIVSFTAHYQEDFWPANCFYAFDEKNDNPSRTTYVKE